MTTTHPNSMNQVSTAHQIPSNHAGNSARAGQSNHMLRDARFNHGSRDARFDHTFRDARFDHAFHDGHFDHVFHDHFFHNHFFHDHFFHDRFFRNRDFAFFFFPGLFYPFYFPGFYPFFSCPHYLYPSYYSDLYDPQYYAGYSSSVLPDDDTPPRLPPGNAPPMPPAEVAAAPADASVHIAVRVPADADFWIDGVKTKQTGDVRQFVSPPLSRGQEYTYDLTARWTENGKEVTRTRQILVHAGERGGVDFTLPKAESIAPPKVKK